MREKLAESYRANRTLRVSLWFVVLSGAILYFKSGGHSPPQQAPQQSNGWPFNQGQGTTVSQVQGIPTGSQIPVGQIQIQGAAILPPKPIELDALDVSVNVKGMDKKNGNDAATIKKGTSISDPDTLKLNEQ